MKMMFAKSGCKVFIIVLLAFTFSGCTYKIGQFMPNSHFAFPNSNVKPLGHVSAEVSKITICAPAMVDKEMIDEVMDKALKQKGGDLLINYKNTTSVTFFPSIPIFITRVRLEGTACKMTIGRQYLK